MEKNIAESDSTRSSHKYERKVRKREVNVKTDSLAGEKDSLYWAAVRSVPLRPEEIQSYVHKEKLSLSKDSLQEDDSIKTSVGKKIIQTFLMGGKLFVVLIKMHGSLGPACLPMCLNIIL